MIVHIKSALAGWGEVHIISVSPRLSGLMTILFSSCCRAQGHDFVEKCHMAKAR